jgi:hypothetical protein
MSWFTKSSITSGRQSVQMQLPVCLLPRCSLCWCSTALLFGHMCATTLIYLVHPSVLHWLGKRSQIPGWSCHGPRAVWCPGGRSLLQHPRRPGSPLAESKLRSEPCHHCFWPPLPHHPAGFRRWTNHPCSARASRNFKKNGGKRFVRIN